MQITMELILNYKRYLYEEERSVATIDKYIRDIQRFWTTLDGNQVTKESLISYKQSLMNKYQSTSINSMLISIHGFLDYIGLSQLKVKLLKVQRSLFVEKEKELTKAEYQRLLNAAKGNHNERMYMLLQTICATGIRVSEHQYMTVESLNKGKVSIQNKGKTREIFLPKGLRKILIQYCKRKNIESGAIFITRNGKTLNRSNIWADMKKLCQDARVSKEKVFPHNLRHLFAFTYYRLEKDLVRLADILGHSNIETTRIYTKTTGREYEKKLSRMNLIDLT